MHFFSELLSEWLNEVCEIFVEVVVFIIASSHQ